MASESYKYPMYFLEQIDTGITLETLLVTTGELPRSWASYN
jgi:hypothetical protein